MMELIALIDNEKNIYTFDKGFRVKFASTGKVEIEKLNKQANFIYSSNINSLTCIVGGNGTGKTRLLNNIFKDFGVCKDDTEFMYQIFEDISTKNEKIRFYGIHKEIVIGFEQKQNAEVWEEVGNIEQDIVDSISDYSIIKYSAAIDTHFNEIGSDFIERYDISNTSKLTHGSLSRISMQDMFSQVKFVSDNYSDLNKQDKFIVVKNKKINLELSEKGYAIRSNRDNQLKSKMLKDYPIFLKLMKDYTNENFVEKINKTMRLKMIANIFSMYQGDASSLELAWKAYMEGVTLEETLTDVELEKILINFVRGIINKEMRLTLEDYEEGFQIIRKLSKYSYSLNKSEDREYLKKLISDLNKNELMKDISSVIMFSWESISSGEYSLLNLFGRISNLVNLDQTLQENILLIIDEVDIGLHPEWQRRWASIVPKYLSIVLPSKKINLILSTHSPIVLSDIPKNNIILKEKESSYISMKETFGQNIHSLLMDSFFIDNTIGEFSKNHIEELLNITTPLHEQLYAAVIKQQEEEVSFEDIENNIEEYTGKILKNKIYELIIDDKKEVKEIKKLDELINELNTSEVIIKVFEQRATEYLLENEIKISDSSESENIKDESLGLLIDLIERQIESIGEEFYREHLLRKLDELESKMKIGNKKTISEKEMSGIKNILNQSGLNVYLMNVLGGGQDDKNNTSGFD